MPSSTELAASYICLCVSDNLPVLAEGWLHQSSTALHHSEQNETDPQCSATYNSWQLFIQKAAVRWGNLHRAHSRTRCAWKAKQTVTPCSTPTSSTPLHSSAKWVRQSAPLRPPKSHIVSKCTHWLVARSLHKGQQTRTVQFSHHKHTQNPKNFIRFVSNFGQFTIVKM
jgi:hypothetical protein